MPTLVLQTQTNLGAATWSPLASAGDAIGTLINTITGVMFASNDLFQGAADPSSVIGRGAIYANKIEKQNVRNTCPDQTRGFIDNIGVSVKMSTSISPNDFFTLSPALISSQPYTFPVAATMWQPVDLVDMSMLVGFQSSAEPDPYKPVSPCANFQFDPTNRGDTTFQVCLNDGTDTTFLDTGIVPDADIAYDFLLQFNFDGSMTARIDQIQDSGGIPARVNLYSEIITAGLPTTTVAASAGFIHIMRLDTRTNAAKTFIFLNSRFAVRIGGAFV